MSDRHNSCERCGQLSYYEGHTDWCKAIQELEERVENLASLVDKLSNIILGEK